MLAWAMVQPAASQQLTLSASTSVLMVQQLTSMRLALLTSQLALSLVRLPLSFGMCLTVCFL
jgi:hypothetical protein